MDSSDTMTRYARQICLPQVGSTGQSAIAAAHVLVVGVGGLAAPVLQYLVAAGVGRLTLMDGDTVALSNLQRQTLFREADVGQAKTLAAARTLRELNAGCHIETFETMLSPANVATHVAQSTIVLDCADSFALSYILSDNCKAQRIPLISASVLEYGGYVGGFCGTAPSLRAVFPDLPDRTATCATAGVMGPVVGMIGAAQAQMALAHLIGQTPSPLGQMIRFDMQSFRSSSFRFDGVADTAPDLAFIDTSHIAATDLVIELRGRDEALEPVTENAKRLTVAEFAEQRLQPAAGQRAVFACRSGLRAWQAATHLRSYWDGDISLIALGDMPSTER